MDLNSIAIPETVVVHLELRGEKLYSGDDKNKPMLITLYSPASDNVIEYKRKVQRKAMAKMKKSRSGNIELTPEEIEEQTVDRLVAFTASVENIELNGNNITPANVRDVYSDPRFGWINDQLTDKLGSWDDFLA